MYDYLGILNFLSNTITNIFFEQIFSRLRKSSSPSRWLMSMPPTSPRLKFVHTHPGRSPTPRRPPRHPSSPSARSRSLDLLDQKEGTNEPPTAEPEPLPRPRSRSLDGLLDDDGVAEPEVVARTRSRSLNASTDETIDDSTNFAINSTEKIGDEILSKKSVLESETNKTAEASLSSSNNEDRSPMPVPRLKTKNFGKPEVIDAAKTAQLEESTISSPEDFGEKIIAVGKLPTDGKLPADRKSVIKDIEDNESVDDLGSAGDSCDSSARTSRWERDVEKTGFIAAAKENSCMLLKAKSCGAGLDSDESFSSNEYNRNGADNSANKNKVQQQRGSLLALHAACAADPKRKRNFMNKCVNKVRSLIKK